MRSLMNSLRPFGAGIILQSQTLWRVFVFLYVPIGLLFLVIGAWSRGSEDVTLALLMQDNGSTESLPAYAGIIPHMEAFLWSASLTVCFFTLFVMRRRADHFTGAMRFLLQVGILTGVLMIDNVFKFHGEIAPKNLNIAKQTVVSAYLFIGILIVSSNWREIRSSEYLILLLALALFGVSISLDVLAKQTNGLHRFIEQFRLFLEDGFQFAGIATCLTYFVRYASQRLSITTIES